MNPISQDTNKNEWETNFENLPHDFFIIYELEGKRNKDEGKHIYSKNKKQALELTHLGSLYFYRKLGSPPLQKVVLPSLKPRSADAATCGPAQRGSLREVACPLLWSKRPQGPAWQGPALINGAELLQLRILKTEKTSIHPSIHPSTYLSTYLQCPCIQKRRGVNC